jgi:RNA polymerase sigma factor (sigma-70 family)
LVHARAHRIVGSEADDVVHDLFIRLMRSEPQKDKIASWIYSTSTHLAIDRLRHRLRRDQTWEGDVAASLEQPEDIDTLLAHKELCRRVLVEMDRRTQEAVVLVYFEELTQEEVAAQMGVSRKTVNEWLRRFQKEARRLVAQWRT